MCIWKVAKEDRHCRYCVYRGGCEARPEYYQAEHFEKYHEAMNEVVGSEVLSKRRDRDLVWARYILCHRLFVDGWRHSKIGEFMHMHRTTVIYAIKCVENMFSTPLAYEIEFDIWNRFEEMINL